MFNPTHIAEVYIDRRSRFVALQCLHTHDALTVFRDCADNRFHHSEMSGINEWPTYQLRKLEPDEVSTLSKSCYQSGHLRRVADLVAC